MNIIEIIVKNHTIKSFDATTQTKFSYIARIVCKEGINVVVKKNFFKSYNSVNTNKLRNKHLFADDGRILIARRREKKNKIIKYIILC